MPCELSGQHAAPGRNTTYTSTIHMVPFHEEILNQGFFQTVINVSEKIETE